MGIYAPKYKGESIPRTTSADVTGGLLVQVSGSGTVAHASAASHLTLGVAAFDALSGERVTVEIGGVQRCIASGTVTAGELVDAAATGKVATHTNGTTDYKVYGLALTTATDGNLVEVRPVR